MDETGHQIAVFGRIGSRPFTAAEMKKFYLWPDGRLFTVTDQVKTSDLVPARPAPTPPRGRTAEVPAALKELAR